MMALLSAIGISAFMLMLLTSNIFGQITAGLIIAIVIIAYCKSTDKNDEG